MKRETRCRWCHAVDGEKRCRWCGCQKGFTLIELLVVIIILGILVAIAVPSYLSFRGRATSVAAAANVRAVVPSVESYFADHGSYVGMTIAGLKATYDASIDPAAFTLGSVAPSAATYCIDSTAGGLTWEKDGPSATVAQGACP